MSKKIVVGEIELKNKINNHIVFINHLSKNLNSKIKKNFTICPYLDLSKKKRISEEKYLIKVKKKILKDLTFTLNNHHNINFSEKSWQVILGPWIQYFVYALRNRYKKVSFIIKKYKNLKFYGNVNFNQTLVSKNTEHFLDLHKDNAWNVYIYSLIFKHFDKKKIFLKKINVSAGKYHEQLDQKNFIKIILKSMLGPFSNKQNFFIHKSGLSFKEELLLNLNLRQIPKIIFKDKMKRFNFNVKVREEIEKNFKKINSRNNDQFTKFVNKILIFQLPTFIIEGFKEYNKKSYNINFPGQPKLIFTSNAFDTDEIFKFYLANQLNKKSPPIYCVGQHGNSYNTNINNQYLNELLTCDTFINWGVKKKNQIQFCNFINDLSSENFNKKKFLLLILRSPGSKYSLWDREIHTLYYEKQLLKFLKYLDKKIIKNVIIKIHKSSNLNSDYYLKVQKLFPDLLFIKKNIQIKKYLKKSKLAIFNYDATSYLQLLSSNFPTFAFWHGGTRHVVDEKLKIYKTLNKEKLWSSKPEIIANLINRHWDDIEKFWFDKRLQNAINQTQKNLCKPRGKNYIKELVNIFKKLT